jgi:hypothetical protein
MARKIAFLGRSPGLRKAPEYEFYTKERESQTRFEVKRAKYRGFFYKILDLGSHPTAYVEIPEGHILFQVKYDDIDISIHGGLTYSNLEEDGNYWLGWDYAHFGDYYNHKFSPPLSNEPDRHWTLAEIEKDCKDAIRQIIKIKKFQKEEYYYAVKKRDW